MKKIRLPWRIIFALISGMLMFAFLVVFGVLLLWNLAVYSFAMEWSIAWAIGYFIAATLCFRFKSRWSVAVIDFIIIVSVISISRWLTSSEVIDIPADLELTATKAVVSFCISIVVNNLDWAKNLGS